MAPPDPNKSETENAAEANGDVLEETPPEWNGGLPPETPDWEPGEELLFPVGPVEGE